MSRYFLFLCFLLLFVSNERGVRRMKVSRGCMIVSSSQTSQSSASEHDLKLKCWPKCYFCACNDSLNEMLQLGMQVELMYFAFLVCKTLAFLCVFFINLEMFFKFMGNGAPTLICKHSYCHRDRPRYSSIGPVLFCSVAGVLQVLVYKHMIYNE